MARLRPHEADGTHKQENRTMCCLVDMTWSGQGRRGSGGLRRRLGSQAAEPQSPAAKLPEIDSRVPWRKWGPNTRNPAGGADGVGLAASEGCCQILAIGS